MMQLKMNSCQKSSLTMATQSFLRWMHNHFLLYSPPSHQRSLACFGILVSHHWRPLRTPSLVLQPRRKTMHVSASGLYALLPCLIGPHLELDVNTLLRPSVMLTRTSIESCFWNNIKVIHVKVEQIKILKEEETEYSSMNIGDSSPLCPAVLSGWHFQIWAQPESILSSQGQRKDHIWPPGPLGLSRWDDKSVYLREKYIDNI